MIYVQAFLTAGVICAISQVLIDRTKMTPGRILVTYVVLGVILTGLGLYEPIVEFGGAGATVPLLGFGYSMAEGVKEAVAGGLHKGTAAGNLMRGAYKRQFHCKPSHLWQVIYPLRPAPYCGASGRTNGWAKFSVRSLMFIRISQNTSP